VIHQTSDKKLDVDKKPRHGNPDNSWGVKYERYPNSFNGAHKNASLK